MDIKELHRSVFQWLDRLTYGLDSGRFCFCAEGSLVPTTGHAAQVSTCFAMKAAWQAGIWDEWPEERKKGCVDFIRSFQREDGLFFDSWLNQNAKVHWKDIARLILRRVDWATLRDTKNRNIRAETRQSAATLVMVGEKPAFPLPVELSSSHDVEHYMADFDWSQPWSAGSHLSHQMMFLAINHKCFGISEKYDAIIDEILERLEKIRDSGTGTWFQGNSPDHIKINGAMKIFSGLQWLDRPYPDCTKLLDFALAQPFQCDGCGFLNRLFVVQQSLKGVPFSYRKEDIQKLARRALDEIKKFQKPDGAFSFYQNKAQTNYYGASVSKGLSVSDLHGAAMMCWAVALVMELLGENAPEGADKWKVHRA